MAYVHVTVTTWTADVASDERKDLVHRALAELVPLLRTLPGFASYQVFASDGQVTVASYTWDTHDQAEAGMQRARAWLQQQGMDQWVATATAYSGYMIASS